MDDLLTCPCGTYVERSTKKWPQFAHNDNPNHDTPPHATPLLALCVKPKQGWSQESTRRRSW